VRCEHDVIRRLPIPIHTIMLDQAKRLALVWSALVMLTSAESDPHL